MKTETLPAVLTHSILRVAASNTQKITTSNLIVKSKIENTGNLPSIDKGAEQPENWDELWFGNYE